MTAPAGKPSLKIAEAVVSSRLAACANIVPSVRSVYLWKGKVERARECLLVMKCRRSAFGRLETLIRSVHPHEVPEIIAVPIERGSAAYLRWIASEARR